MKKLDVLKRSVVGVCAATLLTGLCAAPAFAAPTISNGDINTNVTVDVTAVDQISVTLPSSDIAGAANEEGVLTFGTAQKIENTGLLKLKVSNVLVTKDTGATAFSLVNSTNYTDSTDDNALRLALSLGTTEFDLADCLTGKTASIEIAPGQSNALSMSMSGTMKNFTKAATNASTKIADVVITVATI